MLQYARPPSLVAVMNPWARTSTVGMRTLFLVVFWSSSRAVSGSVGAPAVRVYLRDARRIRYAGRVDEHPPTPGAWDTPIEETLARYLRHLDAGGGHDARAVIEAHLRAALRAEPIARGCPSLAMLTPIDLLGVRAHLEMHGQGDVEAALAALAAFLAAGREVGAHALSAEVVAAALQPPEA